MGRSSGTSHGHIPAHARENGINPLAFLDFPARGVSLEEQATALAKKILTSRMSEQGVARAILELVNQETARLEKAIKDAV